MTHVLEFYNRRELFGNECKDLLLGLLIIVYINITELHLKVVQEMLMELVRCFLNITRHEGRRPEWYRVVCVKAG